MGVLFQDEKFLIWYSGQEEKQLRLSSVTEVIRGQRTVCAISMHPTDNRFLDSSKYFSVLFSFTKKNFLFTR